MSGTRPKSYANPLIAGFAAGVVIALVVGLMATINLQYGAPWAKTYTLTAQVSDADSISIGSDVRIAGRLVGQVIGIQAAGDHADVTFHVDEADWPLPSDTSAFVRLATLLGQKYIQLNPGHAADYLADHGTIGVQATKPVVDFDQILNTFDKPTRDSLTSLVRTVSAGVQGQEGTLQQLFPDLSELSVHSQVPTQELVTRDPQLNQILINLGITADQLNQSSNDLAGVIRNLNSVTAALASNEGVALKSYIVNTDTLNLTTHLVLGNGYAAMLDRGLQLLANSQQTGFTQYLNHLLAILIPQTQSFTVPPRGMEPSENVNGHAPNTPAQASIDLIYEIADATSQGTAKGNFFLRQNATSIDVCGLLQCSGLAAGSPPTLPAPSPPPQPCIPLLTCPPPPPCLPIVCAPLPKPPPTPCLPIVCTPLPTPTIPPLPSIIPTPTPPIPTPTLCTPIPILFTCPPSLAPDAANGYTVSQQVGGVTDAWHWLGFWPVRYR